MRLASRGTGLACGVVLTWLLSAAAGHAVMMLPDLIVSDLTVTPEHSTLGTELSAEITVENQGTVSAGGFELHFWHSMWEEEPG